MRRMVVALLVSLVVSTLAFAMTDEPVFRGLRWGDSLDALGEWQVVEENGPIMKVRRVREDMALGSARAFLIEYRFFEGRLFEIAVASRDTMKFEELVRARYGEPALRLYPIDYWFFPQEDTIVAFGIERGIALMILSSQSLQKAATEWERNQKAAEAQAAW